MRLFVSLSLLGLQLPVSDAVSLRTSQVIIPRQAVTQPGHQAPSLVALRNRGTKGDGAGDEEPEEAMTREDMMQAAEAQSAQGVAGAPQPNQQISPEQAAQLQQQVQQMQAQQAARLQQLQAIQAQAQDQPQTVQNSAAVMQSMQPMQMQQYQMAAAAPMQPVVQGMQPMTQEELRRQAFQMKELQQEALAAAQGISAPSQMPPQQQAVPAQPVTQQAEEQDQIVGQAVHVPVRVVQETDMSQQQAIAMAEQQQAASQQQQLQQELQAQQQVAALQQKQALLREQMQQLQQAQAQQQWQQQQQLPQQMSAPQPQQVQQPKPQALVAMNTAATAAAPAPAPSPAAGAAAAVVSVPRPKGWDQCLNFARFVRSKQVTGIELVRTWKSSCEPAVRSGRATERYRLMCNSLGGAVEPFSQQVDYNVEQLCDAVLAVFHDLTAADTVR